MGAFLNRISYHFNGGIASGDFAYAKNNMHLISFILLKAPSFNGKMMEIKRNEGDKRERI